MDLLAFRWNFLKRRTRQISDRKLCIYINNIHIVFPQNKGCIKYTEKTPKASCSFYRLFATWQLHQDAPCLIKSDLLLLVKKTLQQIATELLPSLLQDFNKLVATYRVQSINFVKKTYKNHITIFRLPDWGQLFERSFLPYIHDCSLVMKFAAIGKCMDVLNVEKERNAYELTCT